MVRTSKHYDIEVKYHPRKANVVADALNKNSIGSIAFSFERVRCTSDRNLPRDPSYIAHSR